MFELLFDGKGLSGCDMEGVRKCVNGCVMESVLMAVRWKVCELLFDKKCVKSCLM